MNIDKETKLKVMALEGMIELIKKYKAEKATLMNSLDEDIQAMNGEIVKLQNEILDIYKGGGK